MLQHALTQSLNQNNVLTKALVVNYPKVNNPETISHT